MKKIIFFLFVIAGILGYLFWTEIEATIDFYDFQRENVGAFSKASIDWKPMNFSSAVYSTVATEPISIGSLSVPITFDTIGKEEKADFARAFSASKSITISSSNEAENFFTTHNFTPNEKTSACQFLSKSSGLGACTSNHNLYRAFLEINDTDIHMFSSIADKNLYNRLMIIRSSILDSTNVSGFETSRIKGFLFTIDSNNYTAKIFDSNDQMHKIVFAGLDKAEVAFVLSNITESK